MLSKQVKTRIRRNQQKHRTMAWRRHYDNLTRIPRIRAKMDVNEVYGKNAPAMVPRLVELAREDGGVKQLLDELVQREVPKDPEFVVPQDGFKRGELVTITSSPYSSGKSNLTGNITMERLTFRKKLALLIPKTRHEARANWTQAYDLIHNYR